jgi:hypothetical protein
VDPLFFSVRQRRQRRKRSIYQPFSRRMVFWNFFVYVRQHRQTIAIHKYMKKTREGEDTFSPLLYYLCIVFFVLG